MDSALPIISIKNKKSFWVCLFGSGLDGCNHQMTYRKSSIKPSWATYLFQPQLSGGLTESRGFFNLAKTMVSVLHKELECKVAKWESTSKKVGSHAAEDQKQIRTSNTSNILDQSAWSFTVVINTVKWIIIRERGGGVINFLLLKRGANLREDLKWHWTIPTPQNNGGYQENFPQHQETPWHNQE